MKKEIYKGYWIQDCSATTENILIAAQERGLGSVWLGIYAEEDRVKNLKSLLNLLTSVYPLSIVSLGYPAKKKNRPIDMMNQEFTIMFGKNKDNKEREMLNFKSVSRFV